jgi:uncharacterized protein (DUF58 family)
MNFLKPKIKNNALLWSRLRFLTLLPLVAAAWARLDAVWLIIAFAVALAGFFTGNILMVRWARDEDRKDRESAADHMNE